MAFLMLVAYILVTCTCNSYQAFNTFIDDAFAISASPAWLRSNGHRLWLIAALLPRMLAALARLSCRNLQRSRPIITRLGLSLRLPLLTPSAPPSPHFRLSLAFRCAVASMPMHHRVACLRDDAVFFVFLYQRYLYPVDKKRANEYGFAYEREEGAEKEERDEADEGGNRVMAALATDELQQQHHQPQDDGNDAASSESSGTRTEIPSRHNDRVGAQNRAAARAFDE